MAAGNERQHSLKELTGTQHLKFISSVCLFFSHAATYCSKGLDKSYLM